jgi:NADPH:quinone reductase-like Zn-dependent oxidoreductase
MRSVSEYARALKPTGIYVACAFNPTSLFLGSLISKKGGKRIKSLVSKSVLEDLIAISELLDPGEIKPVIDSRFPLDEAGDAIQYYGERHSQGKVVITMAGETSW